MIRSLTGLAILLAFYACKKDKVEGTVTTDTALAHILRSSPDTISYNSNILFLTGTLWRDFMPEQTNGSGLYSADSLIDKTGTDIPSNLKVRKQYVINGDEVWTSDFDRLTADSPGLLEMRSDNGPKWGPGIYVDVVCEFQIGDTIYRIIAKHEKIIETI